MEVLLLLFCFMACIKLRIIGKALSRAAKGREVAATAALSAGALPSARQLQDPPCWGPRTGSGARAASQARHCVLLERSSSLVEEPNICFCTMFSMRMAYSKTKTFSEK